MFFALSLSLQVKYYFSIANILIFGIDIQTKLTIKCMLLNVFN